MRARESPGERASKIERQAERQIEREREREREREKQTKTNGEEGGKTELVRISNNIRNIKQSALNQLYF